MTWIAEPALRPEIVKSILRGQQNWDLEIKRKGKNVRLPVTLNILRLIKIQLRRSTFSIKRQALIWSISLNGIMGTPLVAG